MAKPQYGTVEHRRARADLARLVADGEAWCVEPVCLMDSRWIEPGSAWDVCHTPNGAAITGAGHARCNRSEGALRGNRLRKRVKTARWVL